MQPYEVNRVFSPALATPTGCRNRVMKTNVNDPVT